MTLNVALVISGDASGARQAVQQTSADMRGLSGDARQMSSAITAANDQAAAASERVTRTLIGQTTAQRNLQAAVASFAGVRNPVDDASYRQRSADIAAYGNQLDQLRAKYNPLYAAEQAHIRNLAEIDRALRVGALGENEHAEAVRRAAAAYEMQVAGLDQVAAHALAAKLQLAEFQRQALAAREQQKADQAQVRVNQLLGVRDPRSMAGSAEASAATFLAFPDAQEGAKNIGLASHEMTNLTYQMNDIVMMLASGQSPFMMMMQQGSQVTQIMGQRGLGEILPAIGSALRSLISPTTLLLAGVTAAGYAGYYAFRSMVPEVKSLDEALADHLEKLRAVEQGYENLPNAVRGAGKASGAVLAFQSQQAIEELRKSFNAGVGGADFIKYFTESSLFSGREDITGTGRSVGMEFSDLGLEEPVRRFIDSVVKGYPAVAQFNQELATMGQAPEATNYLKEKIADILEFTGAMGEAQAAIQAYDRNIGPGGMLRGGGDFARRDMDIYERWRKEENRTLNQMRTSHAADLADLIARSPAERSAAAKQRERAAMLGQEYSGEVQRLRAEQAAALELARAYRELEGAQRQRQRALDETLTSARLDVELIGTNAAETARLRMEHELTQQVRAAAAEANIDEDEAELALIRQKSAEYGRLIALQSARELLRDQGEDMQRLRVEHALLGTSVALRNRLIERMEIEQEIRRRGIDTVGEEAARLRENAEALADARTELERQSDAWDTVRNAGESAIDGIFDRLMDGDWKGALKSLSDEILKTSLELTAKNPIKNALFGTNYGTGADLGSGWLSRLLGGADKSAADNVASILGGSSVGAMTVSAGVVNINGNLGVGGGLGSLGDNIKRLLGGANDNALPAGDAGVMSRIWNFFSGKGLQSHQVAGIMGNIGAESGFNPSALNPSSGAYGLFQHLGSRLTGLGGGAGLQQQLEFAWQELLTSEKGVLKNLLSSTNVREATSAFAGFERAEGWSKANPEGIALWERRLQGSEAALERFAGTAGQATQDLGQFGGGLGKLGEALNQFPSAPGGGGGLLNSLLGGGLNKAFAGTSAFSWLSSNPGGYIGLYSDGGWTGPGAKDQPAGIVHAGEIVWSQADIARAGGVAVVESMRLGRAGYETGGVVEGGYPVSAPAHQRIGGVGGGLNVRFEVVDRAGVTIEQSGEAYQDGNGDMTIPLLVNEIEGRMVSSMQNGPLGRATASTFGLARQTR